MRWALFLVWIWSLSLAFPRVGVHEGFTRLVFDLPSPQTAYRIEEGEGLLTLVFPGLSAPRADQVVNSPEVASVQVVPGKGEVRVLVRTRGPVEVKASRYGDPERLVLDIALKKGETPVKPQAPDPPKAQAPKPPLPGQAHGPLHAGQHGRQLPGEPLHLHPRERLPHPHRTRGGGLLLWPGPGPQGLGPGDPGKRRGEVGKRLTEEAKTAAERILYDIVAQANQRFSQRLAETLGRSLSQATGSPYRGSFPGDFFVLRYAKVPAVLVEIGFGDHPVENLADPDYREKVAQGLLAGILTFLGNGAFAR
jgi:N-acetylmuramoyl-L-alanine amidase